MKYYAVTDDPTELMHFGIKGMHWGVRRTDAQLGHPKTPRSAAYKRASNKLGKMMKSGIEKAKANWNVYNSPKAREDRFMKKAMEQARTGTLKYGKLTDAQVRKITDRLNLERQARQLGGTENPRYGKRIKTAIGEGIVRGIGQGTASYIDERFRGRGRTTAEIKGEKRKAKYDNSIGGRITQRRQAKADQRAEFLKTAYEEGDVHPLDRSFKTANERAKYLAEVKARSKQSDVRRSQKDMFDKSYYSNYGRLMAEKAAGKTDSNNDWTESRSRPRLTSGENYNIQKTSASNGYSSGVIYVAPNGTARIKRQGYNRGRKQR